MHWIHQIEKIIKVATKADPRTEGSATAEQLRFYQMLLRSHPEVRRVGEIGFNAGFSAWAFLDARPDVEVVSFDLCEYAYSQPCKAYLDQCHPGRHTLIPGDSRSSVPAYNGQPFDLVLVDGGHTYDLARADTVNLRNKARPTAIVVMDDILPWRKFGSGPALAAVDLERQHVLQRWYIVECGTKSDGRAARRFFVGRYKAVEQSEEHDPHIVSAIIDALKNSDDMVRFYALKALAKSDGKCAGGQAAVPALAQLLRDKDPKMRHYAAKSLAKIGPENPADVPALTVGLNDLDAKVRYHVALALERVGLAAMSALEQAANDPDEKVRSVAASIIRNGQANTEVAGLEMAR